MCCILDALEAAGRFFGEIGPCKVPRIRSSIIFGVKPKLRFLDMPACRSSAVLVQLHGA